MPALRSAVFPLILLVLLEGPGRADWVPSPVSVSVSQLNNGLYSYAYTVTNTDDRFPADSFDPLLGKVVPYGGSFVYDFRLSGLLISATGNNDEITHFLKLNSGTNITDFNPQTGLVGVNPPNNELDHGQSYSFTLLSPNAPGMVTYAIRTAYLEYYAEESSGTSGGVLGPRTAATPEPGSLMLLASGLLGLLGKACRRTKNGLKSAGPIV